MILGPDDPRAITDPDELKRLRDYTERFNEKWLGIMPLTAKQKADKAKRLDAILAAIDYPNTKDPS
jgi:hypothetical protein